MSDSALDKKEENRGQIPTRKPDSRTILRNAAISFRIERKRQMTHKSLPRLILLGGFLGSGKTTLMMALGEKLAARGLKVAVVTNDQGEFLVDTAFARSRGLAAGEVLGGCFCCNFGELTRILKNLGSAEAPDYILAEPVGSCTDLAATVIGPLSLYHQDLVSLGPYLVLADGLRFAGEYQNLNLEDPVSPREILVSHQLREASRIILSKDDLLNDLERTAAIVRLKALVPGSEILPVSVPENRGLDILMNWALDDSPATRPEPVDIDYELYAAAEAELGWYNGRCTLEKREPSNNPVNPGTTTRAITSGHSATWLAGFAPEELALDIMMEIKSELGSDVAHAKLLLATEAGTLKISLAGLRIQADSGLAPDVYVKKTGLTLNIRALRPPEDLENLARRLIGKATEKYGLQEFDFQSRALIPGAPKPTYRLK